jgi:hypothetical protein
MDEPIMTKEEAINFLNEELDDETLRADAYREAAIALLDHVAGSAVARQRESREAMRRQALDLANMPTTGTIH